MNSVRNGAVLATPGCPIRRSPDQSLLSGSPKLFAASHVLHRLLAPRHPPYALSSLTTDVIATKCAFKTSGYPYAIVKDLSNWTDRAGWIHDVQPAVAQHAANTLSGADRNRTDDLRLARAALSHLSYSPIGKAVTPLGCQAVGIFLPNRITADTLTAFPKVGLGRVELPTLPLSGVRSSQLSYRPGLRAGPSKLDGKHVMLSGCEKRAPPQPLGVDLNNAPIKAVRIDRSVSTLQSKTP